MTASLFDVAGSNESPVGAAAGIDTPSTRWLRGAFWAAALIPPLVFGAAIWWGYRAALHDAEETVQRASTVVLRQAEHALATAADMAATVQQFGSGPDEALRAREFEVHRRLQDLASGLPMVAALTVWDARGRELASSRLYPVPDDVSLAERDYFHRQKEADRGLIVTERFIGQRSGDSLFNVVARRSHADGSFAGVIVVSLRPEHFQAFYQSLARDEPGLATFSLFTQGGVLLTRWPAQENGSTQVAESSPLLVRVRAGQERGVMFMASTFDQERRLVSFRRVAEQPLYVAAALSNSAIFAVWYRVVALLAAILLPITLVLVYVTSVALKKTRREQAMALKLNEESRRRAKAEQALVQAQKLQALSQLTGGVAHDFNNLLAIVSNNLHVFKRLHPELADGRQIAAIARAVTSGVRLTRQLLSFSRKQALKPEAILLQQWLPATGDLLRTTIGRGIELEIDVAPDTAPINVDANELELALINIAVNAKDAMPDGGRLQIRAEDAGTGLDLDRVLIRVSDTGSGIPAEALEKVFDPFFTTKEAGKGTGLGLSQVYGLCVQAGGSATIASTVGRGTVITMLLPQAGAVAVAKSFTAVPAPAQLHGRVLLVEDNDEVAAGVEALLRSAGLTVRLAFNADAALAMFLNEGEQFDAVLTDIAMPGSMNGIELAQRLRQAQPTLPVLLMTGYSARVHEAVAAGWRVLAKPADPGDLLGELNRALQAVRAVDAQLQSTS